MGKIKNWSKLSNPRNAEMGWENDKIIESSEARVYVGKARRRPNVNYLVQYPETASVGSAPVNMSFHDTKEDARKKAVSWMKSHPYASFSTRNGYYYTGYSSEAEEIAENKAEKRLPNNETKIYRRNGKFAVYAKLD